MPIISKETDMEDYVTYEQAIKLKELGFDWECSFHYDSLELNHPLNKTLDWVHYGKSTFFKAPTLSQAQKWLREKGVDLDITLYRDIDATKDVPTIKRYYNCEIAFGEDDEDLDEDFPTYEKALSVGIDKALELIK